MAPPTVEFVKFNGQGWEGSGDLATRLILADGDPRAFRPYEGSDGRSYVTRNIGGKDQAIVTNAPAALRFQDWRLIDEAIIRVSKPNLQAVGDLRAAGLETTLSNGMGYTVFSFERMSDISKAQISMDGLRVTETDRPVFDITNLPLPLIHKDFSFSARQVMASRNGNTPLDTATAELAARRVAETAEELLLGILPIYTYGGGSIYGYTNFPSRITYSMTAPNAAGWSPATTIDEVLAMITASKQAFHYGPWMLYTSTNWDRYLDGDYSSAKGDLTLRQRILSIRGIMGCKTIDYLQFLTNQPFCMVLVQMTSDVVREVIGMDLTTIQWESHGGMQLNFKVMCIMVPQLRTDMNLNTGIVHGSAASGMSTIPIP